MASTAAIPVPHSSTSFTFWHRTWALVCSHEIRGLYQVRLAGGNALVLADPYGSHSINLIAARIGVAGWSSRAAYIPMIAGNSRGALLGEWVDKKAAFAEFEKAHACRF